MLNPLLPRHVDTFRGHKLALWIFGVVIIVRGIMSVNSIVNGRTIASSADGIPLDTYPPAAASTLVALFALLGLANLMLALMGIVVLVRYRALIPLMFVLLLLHHLGRKVILYFFPIVRVGSPPASIINLILLSLMVVGLALSLWRRENLRAS